MNSLLIVLAGLFGTTGMIAAMSVIHRLKLANADMVRAVGSIVTGSNKTALIPGLIIQYSFGVFFAFAYALLVSIAPVHTRGSAFLVSLMAGLVHGLIVGLVLMVEVAEYHPVKKYREAGVPVALSHIAGHLVYGFCIGTAFFMSWSQIQDIVTELYDVRAFADFIGFAFIWGPLFGIPIVFGTYLIYVFAVSKSEPLAPVKQLVSARPAKRKSRAA